MTDNGKLSAVSRLVAERARLMNQCATLQNYLEAAGEQLYRISTQLRNLGLEDQSRTAALLTNVDLKRIRANLIEFTSLSVQLSDVIATLRKEGI